MPAANEPTNTRAPARPRSMRRSLPPTIAAHGAFDGGTAVLAQRQQTQRARDVVRRAERHDGERRCGRRADAVQCGHDVAHRAVAAAGDDHRRAPPLDQRGDAAAVVTVADGVQALDGTRAAQAGERLVPQRRTRTAQRARVHHHPYEVPGRSVHNRPRAADDFGAASVP